MLNSEESWLEGVISIEAALEAKSREVGVIYMNKNRFASKRRRKRDLPLYRLRKWAEQTAVSVNLVDGAFIAERVTGQSHGGVIAQVGARRFVEMGELIEGVEQPLVVMLDGIEDPFNFGQSVRALYAAGVNGVVVRPRNWTSAAGVVARASAGASERMPMAVAETAEAAAEFYSERGLTVACTALDGAVSIYEANLVQPLFLLLGGEKRGITRSFLNQAQLRLAIPYGRRPLLQGSKAFTQSLGTVASTSAIVFEWMRQRNSFLPR